MDAAAAFPLTQQTTADRRHRDQQLGVLKQQTVAEATEAKIKLANSGEESCIFRLACYKPL